MNRTFSGKLRQGFTLVELLTVLAIIAVLTAILLPVFAKVRENGRANSCLSNLRQLGLAIQLYAQDHDDSFPMNRLPDKTHPPTGCSTRAGSFPESGIWGSSTNWKREIMPYVKNTTVFACPSNQYQWSKSGYALLANVPGDETNFYFPQEQRLPASYAMNGNFFHEAVPACWLGEDVVRPRFLPEIKQPSTLILLLESRYSFPDLGNWNLGGKAPDSSTDGPFQTHNAVSNWLFADMHIKGLGVERTCAERMWTDEGKPGKVDGCAKFYPASVKP